MSYNYLKRTPTADGNRRTFTFSCWFKRNATGSGQDQGIFCAGLAGDADNRTTMSAAEQDRYSHQLEVANTRDIQSTNHLLARDSAAWQHLVWSWDTSRTDRKRVEFFHNGVLIDDYDSDMEMVADEEGFINHAGTPHQIGKFPWASDTDSTLGSATDAGWGDFQMFDAYLVDGQDLTPDVFAYSKVGYGGRATGDNGTNSSNIRRGQWVPKPSKTVIADIKDRLGGFGSNGFYLPMNHVNNQGADFHITPDTILKLKTDEQQPKAEVDGNHMSSVREDPFADNLELAIAGTKDGLGDGFGDYSHLIKGYGTPKSVTTSGSPNHTTGNSYYGSAINFDGSDDKLIFDGNVTNPGTGDFTYEWWMMPRDWSGTYTGLLTLTASTAHDRFETAIHSNNIYVYTATGTWRNTGISLPKEQWTHVAFERYNGHLTMYINGAARWVVTNTHNYNEAFSTKQQFGLHGSSHGKFDGQMQDLRCYTGIAKYKGGFDCVKPWYPMFGRLSEKWDFAESGSQGGWYGDSGASIGWDSGGYMSVDNGSDNTFAAARSAICKSGHKYRITGRVKPSLSGSYTFRVRAGGSGESWKVTSGLSNNTWAHFDTGIVTADGANLEIGSIAGGITYLYFDNIEIYTYDYLPIGDSGNSGDTADTKDWRSLGDTTSNNFATFGNKYHGQWYNNSGASDAAVSVWNGGLTARTTGDTASARGTIAVSSGKWYWEIRTDRIHSSPGYGVIVTGGGRNSFSNEGGASYEPQADRYRLHAASYYDGSADVALKDGQIWAAALDADKGEVSFYVDGVFKRTIYGLKDNQRVNDTALFTPDVWTWNDGPVADNQYTINFGQNPSFCGHAVAGTEKDDSGYGTFRHKPPAGYLAMCTANLPEPSIKDPADYYQGLLYCGSGHTGWTNSIKGLKFKPDLVWLKKLTGGSQYGSIIDSLRGPIKRIVPSEALNETEVSDGMLSFDEGGFSVGANNFFDDDGQNYIAYCWKAGGNSNTYNIDGVGYANAADVNFDLGSITPTRASVNTKSGISIVLYDHTVDSPRTFAHGLTKAPEFIINKYLTANNTYNYNVYHHDGHGSGGDARTGRLRLNDTNAYSDESNAWNDVKPTNKLITIGPDSWHGDGSHINICWHSVEGYSHFGRYRGTGNTDGPFIHLGFKPAFIMIKNGSGTNSWNIFDVQRDPYNLVTHYYAPNSTGGGGTNDSFDFLSNGIKFRTSGSGLNGNGNQYLYAAFAEAPFKYANAR